MRSRNPTNPIEEYIESMAPERQELAREVRRIVAATAAHLEGTVQEGLACYFFHGPVCYFAPSRGGIHFGFFRGEELKDPKAWLESRNGKYLHIKVRSLADIDEAYFSTLVREALQLNRS